jgi:HK97 family phage major capsid protein
MTTLEEMKAKLETLKAEAKALTEKDGANIEEIEAKTAEIKELKAKIAIQEQIEAEELESQRFEAENKIKNGKMKGVNNNMDNFENVRDSELYRDGFYNFICGRSLTPEQKEVVNVISTTGVPVPKSFQTKLVDKLMEMNVMRQLATVITTDNDKDIPVVSTHGSAAWTAENGTFNESDDTFAVITLKAYKLTRIVKVSEELLADSGFDIESYLVNEFARAITKAEESAFINGDGIDKPKGVFVEGDVGVTAASATAITADEIIDLYFSLSQAYRNKAVFIANDSTLKAVRKLKDLNNDYLWVKGLDGKPDTLMGRPIYSSEFAPVIASGNRVMAFGDMSYYNIADRGSRTFQRLNELYAANGQVGFRGYERVDGRLLVNEAVKVLKMATA